MPKNIRNIIKVINMFNKLFKCIKSIGEIPKNAPVLKFDIEDDNHNYNNDLDQIDYYE